MTILEDVDVVAGLVIKRRKDSEGDALRIPPYCVFTADGKYLEEFQQLRHARKWAREHGAGCKHENVMEIAKDITETGEPWCWWCRDCGAIRFIRKWTLPRKVGLR